MKMKFRLEQCLTRTQVVELEVPARLLVKGKVPNDEHGTSEQEQAFYDHMDKVGREAIDPTAWEPSDESCNDYFWTAPL